MSEAASHLLPKHLQEFIASCTWTFAKTYADTWPHEYIVREKVDEASFVDLVTHICAHGYEDHFYEKLIVYFEHEGMVYWTMGSPIEKTIIINRCQKEQTYEHRLRCGTLPEQVRPSHFPTPVPVLTVPGAAWGRAISCYDKQ